MKKQQHILATLRPRFGGKLINAVISVRSEQADAVPNIIADITRGLEHSVIEGNEQYLHALAHYRDLPTRPADVELIDTDDLIAELRKRSASLAVGYVSLDLKHRQMLTHGDMMGCKGLLQELWGRNESDIQASNRQSNNMEESQ